MDFEKTVAEIEEITARLNSGGDLDKMVADYKKATELINDCRQYLKRAELQIEQVGKKQKE